MEIEVVTPSDSLEHLKMILEQDENKKGFHAHLGSIDLRNSNYKESETYKKVQWLMQNKTGKLKRVTWGDVLKLIKEGKFMGWNKLQSHSYAYHYFLPYGYTQVPETPEKGIAGMDMMNVNDE